jgi:hypothetical protein
MHHFLSSTCSSMFSVFCEAPRDLRLSLVGILGFLYPPGVDASALFPSSGCSAEYSLGISLHACTPSAFLSNQPDGIPPEFSTLRVSEAALHCLEEYSTSDRILCTLDQDCYFAWFPRTPRGELGSIPTVILSVASATEACDSLNFPLGGPSKHVPCVGSSTLHSSRMMSPAPSLGGGLHLPPAVSWFLFCVQLGLYYETS